MKTFTVSINPNILYWTIEAKNEKQARILAVDEITEYFNEGELSVNDLDVREES